MDETQQFSMFPCWCQAPTLLRQQ